MVAALWTAIAKICRQDDEPFRLWSECTFVEIESYGDRAEPSKVDAEKNSEDEEDVYGHWVRIVVWVPLHDCDVVQLRSYCDVWISSAKV